jgi:hypothetical protein
MNSYSDFSLLPRDLSQQIFNDLQVMILFLFGTPFWVNLIAGNFTPLFGNLRNDVM